MRIAIFVGIFPAISETFILRQITGLLDRGYDVDIYPSAKGDIDHVHPSVLRYGLLNRTILLQKKHGAFGRLLRFPIMAAYLYSRSHKALFNSLNFAKYGWQAARLGTLEDAYCFRPKHRNYDVIHAHFGPQGVRALEMRDIGIIEGPIITSFHGFDVNVVPRKYPALYERLFREGDFFTANSDFIKNRIVELGCPLDKIYVLPEGLNPAEYHFFPRSLKLNETVKILSVARHVEVKGLHYAISAFALARITYPNMIYRIAGDGPMRPLLESLIYHLDLQDNVFLLGIKTCDEIAELLKDSHLFMQPSITCSDGATEAQGLVIQEAQASGLPVLATWQGGIPNGVIPNESAYLVEQRNVSALSERLKYLVAHSKEWPAMGSAGRKLVEENFDILKLNCRLVQLYRQIRHFYTES